MDVKPVVSVIIPAYNAETHIEDTIKSVQKQSFAELEIIVVDDCSYDSTYQKVERMAADDKRIQLIKNEVNIGVAEARNRAIDLCRGKYIAFLDADDIWYEDKLKIQVEIAEKEDADLVYTSYDIIDENGKKAKRSYIVPTAVSYKELLAENFIGCSTVMVNSRILKDYRFEAEYYHEDYVMWLYILSSGGRVVGCERVLTKWRYMPGSRSFGKWNAAKERWKVYRKWCRINLLQSFILLCVYTRRSIKKYS